MSSERVAIGASGVTPATAPGARAPGGDAWKLSTPPVGGRPAEVPEPPKDGGKQGAEAAKQEAVSAQIDSFIRSSDRDLNFQVDAASGKTIVTVRDAGGGVVRMIPDATRLRVAAMLDNGLGVLFDGKA